MLSDPDSTRLVILTDLNGRKLHCLATKDGRVFCPDVDGTFREIVSDLGKDLTAEQSA